MIRLAQKREGMAGTFPLMLVCMMVRGKKTGVLPTRFESLRSAKYPFHGVLFRLKIPKGRSSKRANEFSPEMSECAVRMVQESRGQYPSLWLMVESIAPRIGC